MCSTFSFFMYVVDYMYIVTYLSRIFVSDNIEDNNIDKINKFYIISKLFIACFNKNLNILFIILLSYIISSILFQKIIISNTFFRKLIFVFDSKGKIYENCLIIIFLFHSVPKFSNSERIKIV